MEIIKKEYRLCPCCMEEHEVETVRVLETNIFKNQKIQYEATYDYCRQADELYAVEGMISTNDNVMKDAYRKQVGLLTSQEICEIRRKYSIGQTDLATILGWGGKTITRYESHQVQDVAHDTILRKIDDDPEWFLQLLDKSKEKFVPQVYQKYKSKAESIFLECGDHYLQKTLLAEYAEMNGDAIYCGGTELSIPKIKDIIQFFAASKEVIALYKVKLMKMLWYADNLAYKRSERSLTGLAYQKLTMGAVPIGHNIIMALDGVEYEEIDFPDDRIGYKFLSKKGYEFQHLAEEDISILNEVIKVCGKDSKDEIVARMHKEKAYLETVERDIIHYQYAKELSIS